MVSSPVGYILLSAPIYAKAKGQIRPSQSKQKNPLELPGAYVKENMYRKPLLWVM